MREKPESNARPESGTPNAAKADPAQHDWAIPSLKRLSASDASEGAAMGADGFTNPS